MPYNLNIEGHFLFPALKIDLYGLLSMLRTKNKKTSDNRCPLAEWEVLKWGSFHMH